MAVTLRLALVAVAVSGAPNAVRRGILLAMAGMAVALGMVGVVLDVVAILAVAGTLRGASSATGPGTTVKVAIPIVPLPLDPRMSPPRIPPPAPTTTSPKRRQPTEQPLARKAPLTAGAVPPCEAP